jgi:hypothetical protein
LKTSTEINGYSWRKKVVEKALAELVWRTLIAAEGMEQSVEISRISESAHVGSMGAIGYSMPR